MDTGLIKCVNVGGEMAPKADVRPIVYEWVRDLYMEAKKRNFVFLTSGNTFLKRDFNIVILAYAEGVAV